MPEAASVADLGPSVVPAFAETVGLDKLIGGRGKGRSDSASRETMAPSASAPQPAPAPVAELPKDLLKQTLASIDAMSSAALEITPEDEAVIAQLTESVYPLANHYAKGASALAALFTVAIVGVLGYGFLKYKKYNVKSKPEEKKS